jgi:uncharacterized protein YbgA (DUF1722 family)
MINEPIDLEESQNNLTTRPYRQALYQGVAMEDDFRVRYHFNQIRSLNKPDPVLIHVINYNTNTLSDEEKMYVPTDVYGAFHYVLNKERNISSTPTIKIQAGLTIQIEKHSKTPLKNYVKNYRSPKIMLLMKLDMITKTNLKCSHICMYFPQKKKKLKNI